MSEAELKRLLRQRLDAVEERIQAACRRAGRARNDVKLVAVTKTISPAVAALLPELGIVDLGESRPQELWRKAALLPKSIGWHLVGHLQRNKIERTLPLVRLIHSVDSLHLLDALEQHGQRTDRKPSILLEINASREATKLGFPPEEVPGLVPILQCQLFVQITGLMTMAALDATRQQTRATFRAVRDLRDRLLPGLAPAHPLTHLSMGMTNDFETAIEEGATLIRIGTALFEGLPEAVS
jgi:pyridoxal phosphate enzyme (YggS family)